MNRQTFAKKDLLKLLFDGSSVYSDDGVEMTLISDQIYTHGDWFVQYELIFRFGDKGLWRTFYCVGATERGHQEPWSYTDHDVECEEVAPVEKLVTVYEPIE